MFIHVDRTLRFPLSQQIQSQISTQILQGKLKRGERLPSTRGLADYLGISRNVVLRAYHQLWSEGYLDTRLRSGYYVGASYKVGAGFPTNSPLISDTDEDTIDFRADIPALDYFPRKVWNKLSQKFLLEAPDTFFGYDQPEGCPELRSALTRYIFRIRGIKCHPDQIIITSGKLQAFSLITKLLVKSSDAVLVEDPTSAKIQSFFAKADIHLDTVLVDEWGMNPSLAPSDSKARMIVVTPFHHYPLGNTLPLERRIQLLTLARKKSAYVVECDDDSEFQYESAPISSLRELEPERVIYVGTFSKVLSPTLGLGYLIVPSPLIKDFRELERTLDVFSPIDQMILAMFIEKNYLTQHISHMKKVYYRRKEKLIACLHDRFCKHRVNVRGENAGLHLVADFANIDFSPDLLEHISRCRVRVYPVELYARQKGNHCHQIVIGYGNVSEENIEKGIKRLKLAIDGKIVF